MTSDQYENYAGKINSVQIGKNIISRVMDFTRCEHHGGSLSRLTCIIVMFYCFFFVLLPVDIPSYV